MQTIKQGDSNGLIITTLRITSVVLFFMGAHLIVPKVTNAAANSDNATVQDSLNSDRTSFGKSIGIINSHDSGSNKSKLNIYEPPNYGGPDSEIGSGTR